jgi:hypothetical protein
MQKAHHLFFIGNGSKTHRFFRLRRYPRLIKKVDGIGWTAGIKGRAGELNAHNTALPAVFELVVIERYPEISQLTNAIICGRINRNRLTNVVSVTSYAARSHRPHRNRQIGNALLRTVTDD